MMLRWRLTERCDRLGMCHSDDGRFQVPPRMTRRFGSESPSHAAPLSGPPRKFSCHSSWHHSQRPPCIPSSPQVLTIVGLLGDLHGSSIPTRLLWATGKACSCIELANGNISALQTKSLRSAGMRARSSVLAQIFCYRPSSLLPRSFEATAPSLPVLSPPDADRQASFAGR